MTRKCGIYGIHNIINGKWYIGQSIHLERRRRDHFSKLKYGEHFNHRLQNDFLVDGVHAFEFHILEETTEPVLDVREQAWISYYKSVEPQHGYNQDTGGSINRRFSGEMRLKLSRAGKGRPKSLQMRRRLSLTNRGHPVSQEARRKMSESHKKSLKALVHFHGLHVAQIGKPLSAEHRRKISSSSKGRPHTPEHIRKIIEGRKRYFKALREKKLE
jgi:group I intron endonuclease